MSSFYNINFHRLVLLLLPTMLRQNMVVAFISALVKPIATIHWQLEVYRSQINVAVHSQTCYMQALLNDEFDYNERRIIVRTAPINFDYYLLWQENQNKPIMISKEETDGFAPYLLSRDGLTGANNVDFEIVFPRGYTLSVSEEKHLRVLVNQNKLASKKYIIVYE